MAHEYAHMCRDGHHEIGFNDHEGKHVELCPLCAVKNLDGWQPIETAPKDGERVLLATPESVWFGYWDREVEAEGGQCWRLDDPDMQRFDIVFETVPSRWMSLPDPPSVIDPQSNFDDTVVDDGGWVKPYSEVR